MPEAQTPETPTPAAPPAAGVAPPSPAIDPAELDALRAAASELAKIRADKAAAEQAEAVKRGEYEKVLAEIRAEADTAKQTAARQAEDLALVGLHAGLATEEARAAARTAHGLIPEAKRGTIAESVKAWIKEPDKAPLMIRAYLSPTAANTAPTGSSSRGVQAGADTDAALQWARGRGLLRGDRTPNEHESAAFVRMFRNQRKAG
jgi:hypothetical protein